MKSKNLEIDFVDALSLHERVIALMRRERSTRYAGGKLSEMWAYITPIFWIGLVAGSFHLLGRIVPISTHPALFVATGILPYAIVRQSISSIQRSLVANRFLSRTPGVTLYNILLATSVLELFTSIVVSLVTFSAIILLFDTALPDDIAAVSIGLFLAWLLGISVGLLFLSIGRVSDTFSRAIPLLLRPLFWISGIFYISAELPSSIRYWLSYNPMLHVIEYFRESFFVGYQAAVSDIYYPVGFSIVCLSVSNIVNRWVTNNKLDRHIS